MTLPGAPPHLVLAVGERARGLAEDLCGGSDRCFVLADPDEAGAVLDAELARLPTGWRVLAVGADRDVRVVRAAALARGALDEEVEGVALDVDEDPEPGPGGRPRSASTAALPPPVRRRRRRRGRAATAPGARPRSWSPRSPLADPRCLPGRATGVLI